MDREINLEEFLATHISRYLAEPRLDEIGKISSSEIEAYALGYALGWKTMQEALRVVGLARVIS